MAINLPPISGPRAVYADLRAFFASRRKHEWWAALLALAIPGWFAYGFATHHVEKRYIPPPVIFPAQWPEGRTLSEIRAQQKIDQAIKKKQDAELAALRAKRVAQARELARKMDAMGM